MDKIWIENPSKSEVIVPCGGDEKTEWPRRTEKSRTKNKLWSNESYIRRHFNNKRLSNYTQSI